LDVGSGNGFFKRLCNNFYIHLFSGNFQSRKGVDIVFDAQIMPIKTDTVANISNFSVLEHLEFPIKFLLESYRILIPGGKLFIMVPFMYGEHDQVDYQRYTELGLRKLIESAGFRKNSIIRLGGTLTTFNNMVINLIHNKFSNRSNWYIDTHYKYALLLLSRLISLPFFVLNWPLFFVDKIVDPNSLNCTNFFVIAEKDLFNEK